MKKIIHSEKAPKQIGPYSQAVVDPATGLLFTAGQIALDWSTGQMLEKDIIKQTHQVFANLNEVLRAAGSSFDNVLKVTLYLKDMNDFVKVNEIYSEYFSKDYPARSAVEVAGLPRDALIEIDLIARI